MLRWLVLWFVVLFCSTGWASFYPPEVHSLFREPFLAEWNTEQGQLLLDELSVRARQRREWFEPHPNDQLGLVGSETDSLDEMRRRIALVLAEIGADTHASTLQLGKRFVAVLKDERVRRLTQGLPFEIDGEIYSLHAAWNLTWSFLELAPTFPNIIGKLTDRYFEDYADQMKGLSQEEKDRFFNLGLSYESNSRAKLASGWVFISKEGTILSAQKLYRADLKLLDTFIMNRSEKDPSHFPELWIPTERLVTTRGAFGQPFMRYFVRHHLRLLQRFAERRDSLGYGQAWRDLEVEQPHAGELGRYFNLFSLDFKDDSTLKSHSKKFLPYLMYGLVELARQLDWDAETVIYLTALTESRLRLFNRQVPVWEKGELLDLVLGEDPKSGQKVQVEHPEIHAYYAHLEDLQKFVIQREPKFLQAVGD